MQQLRHGHDAIVTGIGTALADDPQLNDRSGLPRTRPLLRVVLIPHCVCRSIELVKSAANDC